MLWVRLNRLPESTPTIIITVLSLKADTHFTVPRKVEDWVDLVGWLYIPRRIACPQTVTHPSTNRVWCSATTLIEANALHRSQTANDWLHFTLRKELVALWSCLWSSHVGKSCNESPNVSHSAIILSNHFFWFFLSSSYAVIIIKPPLTTARAA